MLFVYQGKELDLRWFIIAGIFVVLSLGPVLFVAGKQVLSHLPCEWLSSNPFLGFYRSPSCLSMFLMLIFSNVIGYGLAKLETRYKNFKRVTTLLGLANFLEFLIIPVRLDARFENIPDYYFNLGATENGPEMTVLDVPIDLYGAQGPAGNYLLYQTVHQKPIVSGYISRTPTI